MIWPKPLTPLPESATTSNCGMAWTLAALKGRTVRPFHSDADGELELLRDYPGAAFPLRPLAFVRRTAAVCRGRAAGLPNIISPSHILIRRATVCLNKRARVQSAARLLTIPWPDL